MKESVEIREIHSGEASLVAHFYFRLFERQFGFLPNVEAYFLRAAADVYDNPEGNRIWIVEENGSICGSIAIIRISEHKAQLRLFGINPKMQGKGIGNALMRTAMNFCSEKGYHHVILWTIDICQSARHLYAKWGFRLTDTMHNTTWASYPMEEELWEYSDIPEIDNEIPKLLSAEQHLDDFKMLISEYTENIMQKGDEVKSTLQSQHLSDELNGLEIKYGKPYGAMYVAYINGKAAGSVAVTRNDDDYCEIKRLYVKPEFRGRHLSKILVEKAIEEARGIGYSYMRLDTFPFMADAIRLYEKFGFEYVAKYNDNPANSAIFMQLKLK